MVLVFLMLGSVVLGFLVGAFWSEFRNTEKRTSAVYAKVGIGCILVIAAAVFCISKGLAYVLSLLLGLAVGIAPYVSKKNEENQENKEEQE